MLYLRYDSRAQSADVDSDCQQSYPDCCATLDYDCISIEQSISIYTRARALHAAYYYIYIILRTTV